MFRHNGSLYINWTLKMRFKTLDIKMHVMFSCFVSKLTIKTHVSVFLQKLRSVYIIAKIRIFLIPVLSQHICQWTQTHGLLSYQALSVTLPGSSEDIFLISSLVTFLFPYRQRYRPPRQICALWARSLMCPVAMKSGEAVRRECARLHTSHGNNMKGWGRVTLRLP